VLPRTDGEPWRDHDYRNWRRRVYQPSAATLGLASGVPYDLRGSFVSLLAWEGQNMLEVARQAGHSLAICERHYAGIFEDYDPANRTSAEAVSRAARDLMCAEYARWSMRAPRSEMQNACKPQQADERIRTADPFITSEVLYQLSYVGAAANASAGPGRSATARAAPYLRPPARARSSGR
jgi:hypothetical protein